MNTEINAIMFPGGGELSWKTGELQFSGNADEAAKVFFDNVVAQYAQQTERLRRVEQALREIAALTPVDGIDAVSIAREVLK